MIQYRDSFVPITMDFKIFLLHHIWSVSLMLTPYLTLLEWWESRHDVVSPLPLWKGPLVHKSYPGLLWLLSTDGSTNQQLWTTPRRTPGRILRTRSRTLAQMLFDALHQWCLRWIWVLNAKHDESYSYSTKFTTNNQDTSSHARCRRPHWPSP